MRKYLLGLFVWLCSSKAIAHPMPGSIVQLSIFDKSIYGLARIPLVELANAVGDDHVSNLADPFLVAYFKNHIKASSAGGSWTTEIKGISQSDYTDPFFGDYEVVMVRFLLTASDIKYLRNFSFNYDVVIHQVVTHSALVYISQDWNNGIHEKNEGQQIGSIEMDVSTGRILPLNVNLEQGSSWKGFKSMVKLGMQHIKEGTDHLLFLVVLLLPSMLLLRNKHWGGFGGSKYSLLHLIKIVTAFTIGHSITLLAGAIGWLNLPGQPVEVLIAFSILVSAIHAIRPIFPGKETYVAAGFGLIHGLAFASILSNLQLSSGKLAISILGFNLGIEIMQLFVIGIIAPWLILLSKTSTYKAVRIIGGVLAGVAAIAWITERISGEANFITGFIEAGTKYGIWCIAGLAITSLVIYATSVFSGRKGSAI